MKRNQFIPTAACLLAALACSTAALAQATAPKPVIAPVSPLVTLYDSGKRAVAPLTAQELAKRDGWKVITENDLKHEFTGDAVFMNDQLAVVLRETSGEGAEVYSRATGKLRATLHPLDAQGRGVPGGFRTTTVENSSAAVALEVTYAIRDRSPVIVRFRLAAGAFFLEARGQSDGLLWIVSHARYVVVPDFFGDDLVYDPSKSVPSDALPTENALLHLVDKGEAIVTCVWASPAQRTQLLMVEQGPGGKGLFADTAIDMQNGKSIWLAVCEAKGIWHVSAVVPGNDKTALDWQPPFPAKWRASMAAFDSSARSWTFVDAAQAHGGAAMETGDHPCWFDAGRAWMRLPAGDPGDKRTIVAYPIDRSRTTPLDIFCLTDLMRDTLGVGPCQYVLDAEGLGSAQAATPEQVTRWMEQQFEKKPSRRETDAVAERLAAMVRQVELVQARIDGYRLFARRVMVICKPAAVQDKDGLAAQILAIAAGMASVETGTRATTVPQTIKDLAARVAALSDKDVALEKGREALSAIRAAGAGQDYDLARLRMSLRRLNILCPLAGDTGDSPAGQVRRQIQQLAETRSQADASRPSSGH